MAKPQPLASFLDHCLGASFKRQGFANVGLFSAWDDIVGASLCLRCVPVHLDWPKRHAFMNKGEMPEPATLTVRVENGFALDLQHMASVLVDRINAYFGWRCVGRIRLRQGTVQRMSGSRPRPRVDPVTHAKLALQVEGVEEEHLRDALARLGEAILGESTSSKAGSPKPSLLEPAKDLSSC